MLALIGVALALLADLAVIGMVLAIVAALVRLLVTLGLAGAVATGVGLGFGAAGADAGAAVLMRVLTFPFAVWALARRRRRVPVSAPVPVPVPEILPPPEPDFALAVTYSGPAETAADKAPGAAWEDLAAMVPLARTGPLFETRAICVEVLRLDGVAKIDLDLFACAAFIRRGGSGFGGTAPVAAVRRSCGLPAQLPADRHAGPVPVEHRAHAPRPAPRRGGRAVACVRGDAARRLHGRHPEVRGEQASRLHLAHRPEGGAQAEPRRRRRTEVGSLKVVMAPNWQRLATVPVAVLDRAFTLARKSF